MPIPAGVEVHGEFASADASALSESAARFSLYGPGGTTALTLNSNDYVAVDQITLASAGTNLTVTVYDGADATVSGGETVAKVIVPTNATVTVVLRTPHVCQKGTYPKVAASALGQVHVQFHGTVGRIGT